MNGCVSTEDAHHRDHDARYDVVIQDGLVVDGTGAPPKPGDVGVIDQVISAVAPPNSLRGQQVLPAAGAVVTPGFVDIHSHADLTLLLDPRAHSALLQGVTSVVTGNCGYGVAPRGTAHIDLITSNAPGRRIDDRLPRLWNSFSEYLDALSAGGTGVNVFPLVAHGALRLAVAGMQPGPLSRSELASMAAMMRAAMKAGAAGFSTGLEYAPGIYATADELTALSRVAGAWGGLYATHCRNRAEHVVSAAQEALAVAAAGGCRLQLSHFVPRPAHPDRTGHQQAVDLCRAAPIAVGFDVFPFSHGPTPLFSALPDWVRHGERDDVARRLGDRALRRRIVDEVHPRFAALARSTVSSGMAMISDGVSGRWTGRTLADLGDGGDPVDAAIEVLSAAGPDYPEVVVLEPWATAEELERALSHSDYFVMGDGVTASLDGPSAGRSFALSDWGWVPAMLGTFVRDRGLVRLEDAVHRMTLGPARQAGIQGRGQLLAGMAADVVVLDLEELEANADPAAPARPAAGIRHVLVNGGLAVRDGRITGLRAGTTGLPRP